MSPPPASESPRPEQDRLPASPPREKAAVWAVVLVFLALGAMPALLDLGREPGVAARIFGGFPGPMQAQAALKDAPLLAH